MVFLLVFLLGARMHGNIAPPIRLEPAREQ